MARLTGARTIGGKFPEKIFVDRSSFLRRIWQASDAVVKFGISPKRYG